MSFLTELAQKGIIEEALVPTLETESKQTGKSVEELLLARGISVTDILEAKGLHYGLPTRTVDAREISFDTLQHIPEESARHYKVVPLAVTDNALEVGIVDPDNIEAKDAVQFISSKTGMPFRLFLISENDYEDILNNYQGLSGEVNKALSDLEMELTAEEKELSKRLDEARRTASGDEADEDALVEDAPVTKIVATVLKHAIDGNASDIHIEPTSENLKVRFRVDGLMSTNLLLPMKVHQAIVARIKILSNMKLDEKRKPQDNRFSAHISGRKIDFRVSTFPAYYGEKIVLRILDQQKGVLPLDEIGFAPRALAAVRAAIKRPYGLILISGPTGSGKTTTLYSMLEEVDRESQNVLSLEDPVEYNISGMNQSQVRPEIGYTFASGLRTTLRQDPDIIMVGEIRDKETAQLAIQAALTGHLVFSTIHTNNAIGVIPRLIDMGVDPFLIAPTLVLTMAQRLVRRLCPKTGKKIPIDGSLKVMLENQFGDIPKKFHAEIPKSDAFYGVEPTEECPKGVRGRMAVFEVLEMNKEIEQIILTDPTEPRLMKAARENGMFTMKEDALLKSMQGLVPFEEVNTLGGIYDTADEEEIAEKEEEAKTAKKPIVVE